MAACPGVPGVRIEATKKREKWILPIFTGDISDQQLDHAAPFARPGWVAAREFACRADKVSVMKMMIVELRVGVVARGIADQCAPALIVVEKAGVAFLWSASGSCGGEEIFERSAQAFG